MADKSRLPGTSRLRFPFWSLLLGAFVACWLAFFFLYPTALNKVGVGHYRIEVAPERFHEIWFLDTFAILASNDTVTAGEDPYAPNRLDYMRRRHSYGPAWLYLRHLGLTRADVVLVGLAQGATFLLAALVLLRPRCARSLFWYLGIFCTTPVLAAIERGNNDLSMFVILAAVVPCLLSGRVAVRWFGVALIVLAAALKYYPAVAVLVLLAPAPMREVRWRLAAAVVALALVVWQVAISVPGLAVLPAPGGILSFGAVDIFRQLGVLGAWPQVVVILVALIAVAGWWRSAMLQEWQPLPAQRRDWIHFTLGSVLLTGCFFVGQHVAYRWIFALWLAPLLWWLPRDLRAPRAVRCLARVTAWLLLVMLWGDALFLFAVHRWPHDEMMRAARWMSLGLQPLTWLFFLCLLGFLTHFARAGFAGLRRDLAVREVGE